MLLGTRLDDANAHDARDHHGMVAMRVRGQVLADPADCPGGFPTLLPGGGAEPGAAPAGKAHVASAGHIVVAAAEGRAGPCPCEAWVLPPRAGRSIEDRISLPVQRPVIPPN